MKMFEINAADVESIQKAVDFLRDLIQSRSLSDRNSIDEARYTCGNLMCIIPREITGKVITPTWPTGGDAA